VVIAGPGSGKTRTLVERARMILASEPRSNVVFVTFTRTSRRDTKKKLEEVLATDKKARKQDLPRVSTLHGFAKSILHKAPKAVGLGRDFCVLVPEKEQKLILAEVIEDLSLSVSGGSLRKAIASKKDTRILEVPAGADAEELLKASERYEALCRFYNAVDIEGLVHAATKVIKEGKARLPHLHFHADEYQDLNHADQELVRVILGSGSHDIVVVGDDDQSIYGFRHARPDGIRELFADRAWEKVIFGKSHRLPGHILRASQALIGKHRGPRLDKGIEIPKDDGRRIPTSVCTTEEIEIELLAALITKEKKERAKDGEKLSYGDLMVLCPTRAISNTLANQLKEKWNIPVRRVAPKSIPDDLWHILLLLRMAERDDDLALRQWLEILEISPEEIRKLRDNALARNKTLFETAREFKNRTLNRFMRGLGDLRGVAGDIPALLKKAKFLAGISALPFEAEAESVSSLIADLYEEYGLLDSEQEDTRTDEVLVTTLHSSKGLEAEIVFIVQLSERYLPNPSHDWDEELRVLYVAMTRARQQLYLSSPYLFDRQKGYKRPSISPFLRLIESHLSIRKVGRAELHRK
jgi:ATP-dependent DNA helicase UvrD/PcrA